MSGSMRKDSRGVWRLRVYRGTDPLTGAPRYRERRYHGTKKDAQTALAELVLDVARDQQPTHERGTLGHLLTEWLAWADIAATTRQGYESKIRTHITPTLGSKQLAKLTTRDLDRLYQQLRAKGAAPASIRQTHAILRRALDQARTWGYLKTNPAAEAKPPRVPKPDLQPPEPAEVQAVLTATTGHALWAAWVLAAATGARRGEVLALRYRDIDLGAGTIRISRSVAKVTGQPIFVKDTKSHASRLVSIDPTVAAALQRHAAKAEQDATDGGVTLTRDSLVFSPELDGSRPWNPTTLSRTWAKARGDLPARLHDLRHFAASVQLEQGVAINTVAARLGHAQASTTVNIYGASMAGADQAAATIMGEALGLGSGGGE